MVFIDRTGKQFTTNEGYEIVIIEYNNTRNVTIQFQDKYKTVRRNIEYRSCVRGEVKNPYHPSVYQHCFIGEGKYKVSINRIHTDEYIEWKNMAKRCFDEEFKKKYPTYKDVTLDEYFYNFQNYGSWREENYYEVDGEHMHLDKDILYKGNKIYAPDKCIFVPEHINTLFTKRDNDRGDCPIGVHYYKTTGKYMASCSTLNGRKHLGYYNTSREAFLVYKQFKEAYIKKVADEYKDKIPKELYEAMYRWVVEIDD